MAPPLDARAVIREHVMNEYMSIRAILSNPNSVAKEVQKAEDLMFGSGYAQEEIDLWKNMKGLEQLEAIEKWKKGNIQQQQQLAKESELSCCQAM